MNTLSNETAMQTQEHQGHRNHSLPGPQQTKAFQVHYHAQVLQPTKHAGSMCATVIATLNLPELRDKPSEADHESETMPNMHCILSQHAHSASLRN